MGQNGSNALEPIKENLIDNPLEHIKSYSPTTQCNQLNESDMKYIKTTYKACMDDDRDMGKGVSKSMKRKMCCEQTDCANPENVIKDCAVESYASVCSVGVGVL
jgi:hypothetical protein